MKRRRKESGHHASGIPTGTRKATNTQTRVLRRDRCGGRARASCVSVSDSDRAGTRSSHEEAEHPRDHGRRHRLLEHQRLQPRDDGLSHAQHRPHRPGRRDLHRPLLAAIVHGGTRGVHYRSIDLPHRSAESRTAWREGRSLREGPDARRTAQAAGLRHRPVRQEPPRRPQRDVADGARVRRVLRQSLPPQRRG